MSKYKDKKPSMIEFTRKYANIDQACEDFFFHAKYPNGYYCEKCGCTHYKKISTRNHVYTCSKCGHQSCLFAGTIFQDCKLDLYKLLLGLFIFFTSNKGVSAMEMRSQLDVNYKTALLLCRKCRVLMTECNSEKILDNMFYEADVAYIGSKSKEYVVVTFNIPCPAKCPIIINIIAIIRTISIEEFLFTFFPSFRIINIG